MKLKIYLPLLFFKSRLKKRNQTKSNLACSFQLGSSGGITFPPKAIVMIFFRFICFFQTLPRTKKSTTLKTRQIKLNKHKNVTDFEPRPIHFSPSTCPDLLCFDHDVAYSLHKTPTLQEKRNDSAFFSYHWVYQELVPWLQR